MSLTPEQLANRRIGGSKAAVIKGLNKYRSRIQQYKIDIGEEEEEDLSENVHVQCGNRIEEPLRRVLESRGIKVNVRKEQFFHPDFPWWSANVDGERDDTVIELKSALDWTMDKSFGPDGSDEIPLEYKYQVSHYMLHPNYKRAELHAVFLPMQMKEAIAKIDFSMEQLVNIVELHEIRSYYIEPDIFLLDDYIQEAEYYWNCVQTRTTPRLIDARDVHALYLQSLPDAKPATDEDLRNYTEWQKAKKDIKEAEKRADSYKDKLTVSFGPYGILTYDGKKVASYKTQNTSGFDLEKCQAEHDLTYYYNALNMESVKKDFPEYVKKTRVLR